MNHSHIVMPSRRPSRSATSPAHYWTPATEPNVLWLTDITKHPTAEGKLYVCAIKDCYSSRIVGCSIDSRMKASLAVSALRNAITLRNPTGTVVHSDRGSQFRSNKFVNALHQNGPTGSMGRVGACGDNAAMDPRRTPASNRDRDRTDLPPTPPSTSHRPSHSHQVGEFSAGLIHAAAFTSGVHAVRMFRGSTSSSQRSTRRAPSM